MVTGALATPIDNGAENAQFDPYKRSDGSHPDVSHPMITGSIGSMQTGQHPMMAGTGVYGNVSDATTKDKPNHTLHTDLSSCPPLSDTAALSSLIAAKSKCQPPTGGSNPTSSAVMDPSIQKHLSSFIGNNGTIYHAVNSQFASKTTASLPSYITNPPTKSPTPLTTAPPTTSSATSVSIEEANATNDVEAIDESMNASPTHTIPPEGYKEINCRTWSDCPCPAGQSQTCMNYKCDCDDPTINAIANLTMSALIAFANSPIVQGMGQLFETISDIVEIGPDIAGLVLGPEAKEALKVAIMAFPDTGPSHIDIATQGVLTQVLGDIPF